MSGKIRKNKNTSKHIKKPLQLLKLQGFHFVELAGFEPATSLLPVNLITTNNVISWPVTNKKNDLPSQH